MNKLKGLKELKFVKPTTFSGDWGEDSEMVIQESDLPYAHKAISWFCLDCLDFNFPADEVIKLNGRFNPSLSEDMVHEMIKTFRLLGSHAVRALDVIVGIG